ncbi:MAG: hypothetical protein V1495_05780 [Pseudomonadota bacterium]
MKKPVWFALSLFACVLPTGLLAEETNLKFVSSKLEAKIYGYLKVDAIFDDSQIYPGNIALFVKSPTTGSANQFNLTANQTRLGLSIKGPADLPPLVSGTIEMDFYGGGAENMPNPRLYKGYVELKWPSFLILAGQDWDTFSLLYPTCLNFGYLGTAGGLQYRRPQLRAIKSFPISAGSKVSFAAAIAKTIPSSLGAAGTSREAGWPTLEGRLAYENKIFENLPLTLAYSGHFGQERVRWNQAPGDINYASWSMNGELLVPLGTRAYFKGEGFLGSNLDAYYGGILQGINAVTGHTIKAMGGWGELTFLSTEKLTFHLGAGVDHPFRDNLNDGDRSQNLAVFGNVYYDFLSYLTLAFEYSHYRTFYKNGPHGDDNRFHTAMILNF